MPRIISESGRMEYRGEVTVTFTGKMDEAEVIRAVHGVVSAYDVEEVDPIRHEDPNG